MKSLFKLRPSHIKVSSLTKVAQRTSPSWGHLSAKGRQFLVQPWLRSPLPYAGGLLFTGVVAAQFVPLPIRPLGQMGTPLALEESLWQGAGLVRQSVADLYRAKRLFTALAAEQSQPETAAKGPTAATPTAKPASTTNPPAAQPAAQPQSTPAQLAAAPPIPPRVNVSTAAVDPATTIDANLEMRVAIAKRASRLEVGVSTTGWLVDVEGQNYCELPAQTSYVAQPNGQGIGFGDCQLSTAVWLEPAGNGYVFVNDRWFKGRVLLLNEGGSLLAVNFVLMQDYLSSVVGSEMYVNWPIEALKAQAVAARSYALTHHVRPASRHYDLDNTQRYQAYLGIGKETNTTQMAVLETAGEFISYNGGIVESLYAASDQIVAEAHGGSGMSQTGAMQLASQGYDYTQILGNYYPGTGLSRLVVN